MKTNSTRADFTSKQLKVVVPEVAGEIRRERQPHASHAGHRMTGLMVLFAGLALLTGLAAPARAQVILTPDKLMFNCKAGTQCGTQTIAVSNVGINVGKYLSGLLKKSKE